MPTHLPTPVLVRFLTPPVEKPGYGVIMTAASDRAISPPRPHSTYRSIGAARDSESGCDYGVGAGGAKGQRRQMPVHRISAGAMMFRPATASHSSYGARSHVSSAPLGAVAVGRQPRLGETGGGERAGDGAGVADRRRSCHTERRLGRLAGVEPLAAAHALRMAALDRLLAESRRSAGPSASRR